MKKILIIRFSSFGDIVQAMSTIDLVKKAYPQCQIHWLCKSEFSELVSLNSHVHKVHGFDKNTGLKGLIQMALELRDEGFDFIYDAHSNLRSFVVSFILRFKNTSVDFVKRGKNRIKRILLFKFRVNKFPRPFKGMLSYIGPLQAWGVEKDSQVTQDWQFSFNQDRRNYLNQFSQKIVLVPSAAWEMKRWPVSHWKNLITILKDKEFVVLGGPKDDFCKELEKVSPERVVNLAGKLSLIESCYLISNSSFVVSADTGLLHVADILGKKSIALIGPTAFGFPTGDHVQTLEIDLPCRPCTKDGRGRCQQNVYQLCMVDLTPELVSGAINKTIT